GVLVPPEPPPPPELPPPSPDDAVGDPDGAPPMNESPWGVVAFEFGEPGDLEPQAATASAAIATTAPARRRRRQMGVRATARPPRGNGTRRRGITARRSPNVGRTRDERSLYVRKLTCWPVSGRRPSALPRSRPQDR